MSWGARMPDLVRRIAAGIGIVVLASVLAACGGIPTSGSVQAGDPFTDEPTGDFVFNPLSPAPGADQRGILEGFVAAFTGPQGDYSVARQFLSSEFKKEWDPRKSVAIRTGSPSISQLGETTMEYAFTTKAQLDEFGVYTAGAPASQSLQFQFVKENGQWRISQAPPGIVLAESTFLTIFSKHALYFYDLSLQHLVPDERWFPGGTTATRIVTALLAGPPEWLKGAVVSQIPDGTQLTPGTTVSIDSTVAQVDLTTEAAGADERQRQLMQLQISESLGSVAGIASVELSVAGSILSIQPIGAGGPVAQRPVDSRPLVLAGDAFGYLSGGEVSPLDQLSAKIVGLSPLAVSLGQNAASAAVLAADGVYAVTEGKTPPSRIDERPGLIAPAVDDFGFIWSVPRAQPNAVIVYDPDGKPHPVALSLPAASSIVSLDIAQDDVRVAMLLQTPAGPRLVVAAITRDPASGYLPTTVGAAALDVLLGQSLAVDAAWIDQFSVATLTDDDGDSAVDSFEVGGQRTSLGRPAPSVAIVGGNGRLGLRLLGADQLLQSPRGSGWQATTTKVDLLATQR